MALYEQQNYLTPSRYISGRIVEYDIRSANISCLMQAGVISTEDYIFLSRLPKQQREIEIGLRKKADPSLYTTEKTMIKDARKYLLESNNIDEFNVVRIANDAVYINTPVNLTNTKIGQYIEFRPKSVSDVFLNLNAVDRDLVVFISFLQDGNIDMSVKGIREDKFKLHENAMATVIAYTVASLERGGIETAIQYLSSIIEQYLNRILPIDFYREFNSTSSYRIINSNLSPMCLTEYDKNMVDIGYNYNILREMWSILVEKYSMRK